MAFTKVGPMKAIKLKDGREAFVGDLGMANLWVMQTKDGNGWELLISESNRAENRGYASPERTTPSQGGGQWKENKANPERKTYAPNYAPRAESRDQGPPVDNDPWPDAP